jgi:hypothetical protein
MILSSGCIHYAVISSTDFLSVMDASIEKYKEIVDTLECLPLKLMMPVLSYKLKVLSDCGYHFMSEFTSVCISGQCCYE